MVGDVMFSSALLLTQYLAKYATDFHQIYINDALWDEASHFGVRRKGHGEIKYTGSSNLGLLLTLVGLSVWPSWFMPQCTLPLTGGWLTALGQIYRPAHAAPLPHRHKARQGKATLVLSGNHFTGSATETYSTRCSAIQLEFLVYMSFLTDLGFSALALLVACQDFYQTCEKYYTTVQ